METSRYLEMMNMDTVSKIIGPIFVSSYEGAKDFRGDILFVHHDIEWYTRGWHLPLLQSRPNSDTDRTGAKVNYDNLELIHDIIQFHYDAGSPLLVHCKGGVERSPLCVVTWLNLCKDHSLDSAYEYVKNARPVVEDRRYWL